MSTLHKNIYFAALEHGATNMKGISCNGMVEYLRSKNVGWEDQMQEAFQYWFFLNFHHDLGSLAANKRKYASGGSHFMDVSNHLNQLAVMTGDAYMRYVDILELSEARKATHNAEKHAHQANINALESSKAAKKAYNLAMYALIASIAFSLIQIFIVTTNESPSTELENHKMESKAFEYPYNLGDSLKAQSEQEITETDTTSQPSK